MIVSGLPDAKISAVFADKIALQRGLGLCVIRDVVEFCFGSFAVTDRADGKHPFCVIPDVFVIVADDPREEL